MRHGAIDRILDGDRVSFQRTLADLQNLLLGGVHKPVHFLGILIGLLNQCGRLDNDLAQEVFVLENVEVENQIRRRGHGGGHLGEISAPASLVEHAAIMQLLRHSDQVNGFRGTVQRRHVGNRLVDELIFQVVEILLCDISLLTKTDGIAGIEKDRAQDAFLRVQSVRGQAVELNDGILGLCGFVKVRLENILL